MSIKICPGEYEANITREEVVWSRRVLAAKDGTIWARLFMVDREGCWSLSSILRQWLGSETNKEGARGGGRFEGNGGWWPPRAPLTVIFGFSST